ncbi:MAG: AAA family ATPase [Deltaproteobacteria bacterium]|nr:AAA family ATPase [Deltaproteobacteria bacterium]
MDVTDGAAKLRARRSRPAAGWSPRASRQGSPTIRLTDVRVTKFRCIDDSTEVHLEPESTAIVGRNEAGKTAFLEALRRLSPIDGVGFDLVQDYPRPQLAAYRPRHATDPEIGVTGKLLLDDEDVADVERRFGRGVIKKRQIIVKRDYQNRLQVQMELDEGALVRALVAARADLPEDVGAAAADAPTLAALVDVLTGAEGPEAASLGLVVARLAEVPLVSRVWKDVLAAKMPRVMLFSELDIVPSAVALSRLRDPEALRDPGVATAAALLDVAGLTAADLDPDAQSHEELRSRIENAALGVTEELRRFWTQEHDLEVLVDVTPAGARDALFEPGTPVLRIRIGSRRERVSLPVSERSRGFNWFFSFLVRLAHLANHATSVVILLDEPGRSLHALAQADFLRFVEQRMAPDHQLVFATHSPFLLDPTQLGRVRVVSRTAVRGTIVTSDLTKADADSLIPLRAAAAGAVVDDVLPSGPGLVVREASDLIWLRGFSEQAMKRKKTGLDARWSIAPVGGAAGLVELALAAGRGGREAVMLFQPTPAESVQLAQLAATHLVDTNRYMTLDPIAPGATVLEDLLDVQYWLALVREAYRLEVPINDSDLPASGTIIDKTRAVLKARGITLDRLTVADLGLRRLGSSPVPPSTVDRFVRLFETLNALLPP